MKFLSLIFSARPESGPKILEIDSQAGNNIEISSTSSQSPFWILLRTIIQFLMFSLAHVEMRKGRTNELFGTIRHPPGISVRNNKNWNSI